MASSLADNEPKAQPGAISLEQLTITNEKLMLENGEKEKKIASLITTNRQLLAQAKEKDMQIAGLITEKMESAYAFDEKEKLAQALRAVSGHLSKTESDMSIQNDKLEQGIKLNSETVLKKLEKNIILETIGDGFYALDSNWIVTYWNRGAEEKLGVKKNDIIGKSLWKVFPGSEDTISYRNHHYAMQTKQPMHFEDHYSALNVWFEISSYPSENGMSVFFKDITERKVSEKRINESDVRLDALEHLLNKANTLARIGSWEVDLIKGTVYWNDITREIHEAENDFVPDLATGLNFYKEGPGRDLITQKVKDTIELGKPWDEELEIVTAKSNVRWIRTIGEAEFVDGKCVKIYGSFQDIDRRKKAEEKLNESFNRYHRLFDTSPIAITEEDHTPFYEKVQSLRKSGILKNYETYFADHSEELYEMLGRVQILGVNQGLLDLTGAKNLEDFVANRSKFFVSMTEMTVFKLMDLIRDGGGYFEEETKIKNLSGEIKEVVVRLKYPAAPPYSSVAITMLDVTKQKEFDQKIAESEELFRTFSDNIQNLAWMADKDGSIYWYNQRWYDYTGTTFDEMQGWGWEKVHHPDHVDSVVDFAKKAWHKPEPFELTFPLKGADGGYRWFLTLCVPILDAQGNILRWIGTNTDIHEQKQAQEKIKESEEKFRTLVEQAADGIVIVDQEGNYLEVNESMAKLTGHSIEELTKMNGNQIVEREDLKTNPMKLEELKTGKPVYVERVIVKKDGTLINVEISAKLMNNGKVICIMRDITDRKKAEKKILLSEKRLLKAQEIGKFGYWQQDLDSGVIWASKEAMRIYGFEAAEGELEREKIASCIIDIEKVKEAAVNLVDHDREYNIEIRINPSDGSQMRYISALAELEKNENGKPVRLVGTLQDITERKKAEETIKLNEQKLKLIYNTTKDVIFLLSVKNDRYCFNSVNLTFLEATGLTENQVIGKFVDEIIPEPSLSIVLKNYRAAIDSKQTVQWEETSEYPSGTKTGIVNITPVFDSNGKCSVLVGSVHDITERKKAESKLAENENYLRTILNTEPECVKVLNKKGELLTMNPAGLAMIEADNQQQVIGCRMTELVVKKYRSGFNRLSKQVFNGTTGTFEFEITGLKGGRRWLETHAVPLKDTAGKIVNLLGVTRDITARKKADEEILNTTEQLRQLTTHLQTVREEERKRIAREIHDELGQQLTAIKMDTVWIDKQIPPQTINVKNKLQNIIELLDGTHQSVRKILNELRPSALDDNGLLEALQWLGQQFTESTGTPVTFTSNQTSMHLPQETATCIFRVYQEALTNIMRYAGAKTVKISLNVFNTSIILIIKDDGKGFDANTATSTKKFGLLGMKERVYSQKGIFKLDSSPGHGTSIMIELPMTVI